MRKGHILLVTIPMLAAAIFAPQVALPQNTAADSRMDGAADDAALSAARTRASERAEAMLAQAADSDDPAERDRLALGALGLRVTAAEAEVARARAALTRAQQAEQTQYARLRAEQRPLMRLTAQLQRLTMRPPISLLAAPGTTSDIVHQRMMMAAILPQIRTRAARLTAAIQSARALRQSRSAAFALLQGQMTALQGARRELAAASAAGAGRGNAMAGLAADRAVALAQDAQDVGALVSALEAGSALSARLAAFDGPVPRPGSVADSTNRAGNDGRGDDGGGNAATSVRPAYILPAIGRLEVGLGENSADGNRSRGLTIRVAPGAQIIAPAAGRIAYAGSFRSFGRIIIIDHGHGWSSLITNLSAIEARVGDDVEQGAPLGRAGPDNPRIIVELRRNGQPMDIGALVS